MSRIYEELPCGCLISEDGGGGLIPCDASGAYDLTNNERHDKKAVDLHQKSMKDYDEAKSNQTA